MIHKCICSQYSWKPPPTAPKQTRTGGHGRGRARHSLREAETLPWQGEGRGILPASRPAPTVGY